MMLLKPRFETIAQQMRGRHFGEAAGALRVRVESILKRWRMQSLLAVPELDRLTIVEFEDSMALILRTIAAAMETNDPDQLRSVMEGGPLHGGDRFLQEFTLDTLLAEEATLRGVIILELREEMGRTLAEDEAAALHELIGLTLDHSILAFVHERGEQVQQQMAGVQRLADLGTLVAGVAHDAANLLLPFRISVERLKHCELPADARSHVQIIEHVFQHYQNTIINLRWLSVDASHRPTASYSLDLHAFGNEFKSFQRTMLPGTIAFDVDIPEGLSHPRISQAALSQILFNLIRNAQHAILSHSKRGRITINARAGPNDTVELRVEDDGPGMPPKVRQRCMEPYFTTKQHTFGTGLGLSLVQSLVAGVGGTIEIHSPLPGKPDGTGGTVFVLSFQCEPESLESAEATHDSKTGDQGHRSQHRRGVLCVDDNGAVLDALESSFSELATYEWKGSLSSADDLRSTVEQRNREAATDGSPPVAVVVLDIEMPGKDVFTAAAELVICYPEIAIVFFSGALTPDHLSRAREAAPGSVCVRKDEGVTALLTAIATTGKDSNQTSM